MVAAATVWVLASPRVESGSSRPGSAVRRPAFYPRRGFSGLGGGRRASRRVGQPRGPAFVFPRSNSKEEKRENGESLHCFIVVRRVHEFVSPICVRRSLLVRFFCSCSRLFQRFFCDSACLVAAILNICLFISGPNGLLSFFISRYKPTVPRRRRLFLSGLYLVLIVVCTEFFFGVAHTKFSVCVGPELAAATASSHVFFCGGRPFKPHLMNKSRGKKNSHRVVPGFAGRGPRFTEFSSGPEPRVNENSVKTR